MTQDVYFTEIQFIEICKTGFLAEQPVSKTELKSMLNVGSIDRTIKGSKYRIHMPKLEYELLKGIIERSPLYSDLIVPLPTLKNPPIIGSYEPPSE